MVYEWQWAALLFESPVLAPIGSMIIGSKLDTDVNANTCRIAFYGRLAEALPTADIHELRPLNIYKQKEKVGAVDRIESKPEGGGPGPVVVIGRSLFKKETDMSQFTGLALHSKAGQVATLDSSFGKSGKFKATFAQPDRVDPYAAALGAGKSIGDARAAALAAGVTEKGATVPVAGTPVPPIRPGDPIYLRFRKYMYERKGEAGAAKNRILVQ